MFLKKSKNKWNKHLLLNFWLLMSWNQLELNAGVLLDVEILHFLFKKYPGICQTNIIILVVDFFSFYFYLFIFSYLALDIKMNINSGTLFE